MSGRTLTLTRASEIDALLAELLGGPFEKATVTGACGRSVRAGAGARRVRRLCAPLAR
ncbi:hypothetical protein [Actinomadura sp. NBRC 104412]|uniref:hypothetical protein n=1 Tax=Actinomadura sp. NBRC 104412 TaxID=3032203 RepID=UPI0025566A03|nr:hypothetical protein [Actinomadura sp. NBRC 104412]